MEQNQKNGVMKERKRREKERKREREKERKRREKTKELPHHIPPQHSSNA